MTKRYLARNTLLIGTLEFAQSLGIDRGEILAEIGLDPALAEGVGTLVPSEALIDAIEYAAVRSGRSDFGLMLGARQDHRLMGPLGLLFEQANSIVEAQAFSERFFHLHNPALNYKLVRVKGGAMTQLHIRSTGAFEPRHYVECLFLICIRMTQIILGPRWRPVHVSLKHQRLANRAAYERHFRAETRFGHDVNAIACSASDLARRVEARSPDLKRKLVVMLQELDSSYAGDFRGKVAHLVRALLPGGQASIGQVAKLLSLTPRTLQRKLKARKLNFTKILAETRVAIAREYLRGSDTTLTEIAPILGFSEVSAVSRFLREQAGITARELRNLQPLSRRVA